MDKDEVQSGLVDIIFKVGETLNIEIIEYRINNACGKGDSFVGGIYKVFITGIKDGQKIKNLILIKWISSPEKRRMFQEAYRREILAYSRVIPNFLEIQRSITIAEGLRMKFPKCILTDDDNYEFIATHYLDEKYKMAEKNCKPDFTSAALILKELAKFHGLSFILEKRKPDDFEKIKKVCSKDVQYADPNAAPKYMRYYYDASVNVIRDPVAKSKLERLAPDFFRVLHKCTIPTEYSCLGHGDCWINNALFKYNGKTPVDICLVDYQLIRYASPVTDISFYFSMSTDHDLRSKHYSQLLDIYYGTLTAVLEEGSLNVNEVYPRKIFEQHLRKYSVLGLLEALIALKIITGSPEDALDMSEMREKITSAPMVNEKKEHLFIDRVNGVVNDFFANGYSLDEVLGESNNN